MPQINQPQETCPICSSLIEEYLINLETRMSMCENVKCTYPFNKSNPKEFIVKATGSTNNDNKYSNSSSNIKNSTNECGPMKDHLYRIRFNNNTSIFRNFYFYSRYTSFQKISTISIHCGTNSSLTASTYTYKTNINNSQSAGTNTKHQGNEQHH
ncbi:hypothetical protein BC941DRAFT_256839 [Chlamydoabsidia padenii]|nr:hypothetical protein BC941DRAFT_256839 [Chlamydoabsidia padenii]